ncbi:MAG: hypothetical protein C5B59_19770 [Bacteroidetes bacterium]|nr:MAG: hypothetical protein C5B59_19770 [Bacteroidota bacterium]
MNAIYTEEQKFDQKIIRLILLGILLAMTILSGVIVLVEKSYVGIISFVVTLSIFILFKLLTLETKITNDTFCFRFLPFQIKFKCITKSEISKIKVTKYYPITDYGGWGIRFGRAGKAYTTSGNFGISITLSTGKNVMIGTRQPEAVEKFLAENGYPITEGT